MDKLGGKAFLLHLGIFAIGIPLVVVERLGQGGKPVSWEAALGTSLFPNTFSPLYCAIFRQTWRRS